MKLDSLLLYYQQYTKIIVSYILCLSEWNLNSSHSYPSVYRAGFHSLALLTSIILQHLAVHFSSCASFFDPNSLFVSYLVIVDRCRAPWFALRGFALNSVSCKIFSLDSETVTALYDAFPLSFFICFCNLLQLSLQSVMVSLTRSINSFRLRIFASCSLNWSLFQCYLTKLINAIVVISSASPMSSSIWLLSLWFLLQHLLFQPYVCNYISGSLYLH